MSVDLAAQANQAAAQGNQMLAQDQANASQYKTQYGQYQAQADAANKNVENYSQYMQGEGSAGNQYTGQLNTQLGQLGYDPNQMAAARGNLNQATGAMSAYSDFANTAASKFGMNAGSFAAANSNALGSLNNNIASNQQVVTGLNNLYTTAQTGANQYTGNVIQGQHETLAGLQDVFSNAASQRDSASSMMNFYNDLAQKQGGLNAQQQQYYAQAQQAYASANAALAQAGLYGAQADYTRSQLTGQNLTNQQTQAAMTAAAAKASAKAQSDYNNSVGLSWNGQYDNNGSKILTAKF